MTQRNASPARDSEANHNEQLLHHFRQGLTGVTDKAEQAVRVGVELKFPVVQADGHPATLQQIRAMWHWLVDQGWTADIDPDSGQIIGAKLPGEQNDTVAGSETGYCKAEFALAHTSDLHHMQQQINALRQTFRPFTAQHGLHLLSYGIHPVAQPGEALQIQKTRASVWGSIFRSNNLVEPDVGDDVHLFTLNAGSHVHVALPADQAIDAVNVLNGFAGPQIALSAHANIWRGEIDDKHVCVSEAFWDWWKPVQGRIGMPDRPFADLDDYVDHVAEMPLLYVKRDDGPVALEPGTSLKDFFEQGEAVGRTLDGEPTQVEPKSSDVKLHNSCYWYNARLSRYFTVENRIHDQQPPKDLLAPAALTLGLVHALDEAQEELQSRSWDDRRDDRIHAYRHGLNGHSVDAEETSNGDEPQLSDQVQRMLDVAMLGLERRGQGEERFLKPLLDRVQDQQCPADVAREHFEAGGVEKLIEETCFTSADHEA